MMGLDAATAPAPGEQGLPCEHGGDIVWQDRLSDALALAGQQRQPLLVMALGQGMGAPDDW